jgi:ribonuclease E
MGNEEDAPPLDDERLAEPVALALPEEEAPLAEASPAMPQGVVAEAATTIAESAPYDPAMLTHAPATTPLDLAMLTPAPATTPLAPEPPALDAAMLTPAPATTPLPHDAETAKSAEPFDPAMLTPAPATTPLRAETPPLDPAMLLRTRATTPLRHDHQDAEPRAEQRAAPVDASADMPTPRAEVVPVVEPPTPSEERASEPPVAVGDAPLAVEPERDALTADVPSARSAFSRITRPIVGLGTTLDALSRAASPSGPRASAPESGLWERLSQALIDRSGAPSSPFAAPQAPRPSAPETTGASPASEIDETPQA